jgi:hypothetical protein
MSRIRISAIKLSVLSVLLSFSRCWDCTDRRTITDPFLPIVPCVDNNISIIYSYRSESYHLNLMQDADYQRQLIMTLTYLRKLLMTSFSCLCWYRQHCQAVRTWRWFRAVLSCRPTFDGHFARTVDLVVTARRHRKEDSKLRYAPASRAARATHVYDCLQ